MAKIFKFTAYVVDVNDDFDSADDYIDYVNNGIKYDGDIIPFNSSTVNVEWDDDIDINKCDCPQESYDKYFRGDT